MTGIIIYTTTTTTNNNNDNNYIYICIHTCISIYLSIYLSIYIYINNNNTIYTYWFAARSCASLRSTYCIHKIY